MRAFSGESRTLCRKELVMKKLALLTLCMLILILTETVFAFAKEGPVILQEESEGMGLVHLQGEELAQLEGRDAEANFQIGRVSFDRDISDYLLKETRKELHIALFNNAADERFIYEDYLFVGTPTFAESDGETTSAIVVDDSVGRMQMKVILDWEIKDAKKLRYYYHPVEKGDRTEIQAAYDTADNSVTFDMKDRGFYAVYCDDPTLTGNTAEKETPMGLYLGCGVAAAVLGTAGFILYRRTKKR